MKRLAVAALLAALVVFAAGCGDIEKDTGKTLVISQAEEDIVGAIQVDVTEDEAAQQEQTPEKKVKVTAKSLNVRKEPNADAERIATLKEGDMVDYLDETDGWYQIQGESDGETFTGYISGNYAQIVEPENEGGGTEETDMPENEGSGQGDDGSENESGQSDENGDPENENGQDVESAEDAQAAGEVKVTAKTLKVRQSPSTDAEVIAGLKKGDQAQYVSEEDGWYKIIVVIDGKKSIGYISADYAEVTD